MEVVENVEVVETTTAGIAMIHICAGDAVAHEK